ncbi:MAG: DUF1329 domain-containing protein, partial [Nevskiales bacterium]
MNRRLNRSITTLLLASGLSLSAQAGVSPEQAAQLGQSLTPVGAEKAGNASGSIPAWNGPANFSDEKKKLTRAQLEDMRKNRPQEFENFLNTPPGEPLYVITKDNLGQYQGQLTAGHIALFRRYPDYRMKVYKTVRSAYYPDAIYTATRANATRAKLDGTDSVHGAELGFPFPIPKNGAEVIWNHKMKFRGSAVRRYNNQAIVKQDGDFLISK